MKKPRLFVIRTILQRPYLAGTLSREKCPTRKTDRLKLTYPIHPSTPDIHKYFSINHLTNKPTIFPHTYDQLRRQQMPISALTRSILEPPNGGNGLPLAAQANFIPGGCLLSITIHHSLFDGLGAESIIADWARNCKEITDHNGHSHPEENIKLLSLPPPFQEDPNNNNPHPNPPTPETYHLLGMLPPSTPSSPPTPLPKVPPSSSPLLPAIFTIPPTLLSHLKAHSTPPPYDISWPTITTFDSLAALLWRCILRARLPDLPQPLKPTTHSWQTRYTRVSWGRWSRRRGRR